MQSLWRALRPYLILSLLGLVLIWPLFGADVPCTDDGQLYYYQAAVQRYGIEHGLVYSRWMPDAALGYGIPFFNYREPLPRFLPLILHLLGMGIPRALNLVSALTVLATGWGTYRLTRDVFDSESAGVVAGAAAMIAPYHLITVYRRGSLPELVALALLPWVFWAFWRSGQNRRAMVGAALAWAALILSHNISTLLLAPVLGGYAVLLAWVNRRVGDDHADDSPAPDKIGGGVGRGDWPVAPTKICHPLLAFIGGLGLAAFFWIPGFFEKGLVQIGSATATRNNSYLFNFASLKELFAAPQPYNPAWFNPSMVFPVGLVAVILALIGLVGGWFVYTDRTRRTHLIGFAAVGLIYLGMALPASQPIWDVIPTLAFVQFPWRLIGRAALPVAVLAGVGIDVIKRATGQSPLRDPILTGIGCLALLLAGMPYTYPVFWCPSPSHPTITDVNQFELGLPGLDNESSYFPVGVVPPGNTPLLADYESGRTPQRFDMSLVPKQANIEVNYRPLGAVLSIETTETFTAHYLTYAFPGWQVRIDGQRVDIVPEEANKLITFEVPEGQHEITIRFGTTPLRAAATVVSVLSLIGLMAMLVLPPVQPDGCIRPPCKGGKSERSEDWGVIPQTALWMVVGAVGLLLIIARIAWPENVPSPWIASREPQPDQSISAIFDGQVELLGYDLGREIWTADKELRIDTYWQRIADMDRNTQVAISVVDEAGITWSEKEGARPRGYEHPPMATFLWPGDVYVVDSQLISLLPGTPPGEYQLMVTLFQSETGIPFVTPGRDGGVTAQFPIGTVRVEKPGEPFGIDQLGIQYPTDLAIGNRQLIGYNLDRETAAPGDTVLVTLFWESNDADPTEFALTLDGERISTQPDSLDQPYSPSTGRWREQYFVRIPPETEAGQHQIGIDAVKIAAIEVTAVERQFEAPAVSIPVDAILSQSVRLAGITVDEDGEQTRVRLVWQAEADMPIGYTVFVHTLDGDGNLIAQSDSFPAGGTRPTTGWLAGEYVIDDHLLAVPVEQAAAFRVGLYDPSTGLRLRLPDGSDAVIVPQE